MSVKLDDVVEDSVSATKDLYSSVKRHRDGKEIRTYSHSTPVINDLTDAETAVTCLDTLSAIVKNSVPENYSVVNQNTSVNFDDLNAPTVDCEFEIEVSRNS